MLELYNFAESTCSQKVRIVLAEKGLDWVDHIVDYRVEEHLSPEYLKLNPNGVVPTLVHDGEAIIDSSCIMEYLDEAFPAPVLAPPDLLGLTRMRVWLRFIEELPTAAIRYPSFNYGLLPAFQAWSAEEFEERSGNRPLRKHFYERMGQGGFGEKDMANAMEDLQKTVQRMEDALGDGRPWLRGEQFTLADIAVAPSFDRMEDLALSHVWESGSPGVTAWYARLRARPSYDVAFYKGVRFSDVFPWVEERRKTA